MTIVMGVFEVVGIIIVILAFYLLFVAFVPVLRQPKQRLEKARQGLKESDAKLAQARKEVRFSVKGALLSAWLYMPRICLHRFHASLWEMAPVAPRRWQAWNVMRFDTGRPALPC
jgi:hypothetical protein